MCSISIIDNARGGRYNCQSMDIALIKVIDMDLRKQMDHIYRDIPRDRIPWNLDNPPALLVDAVRQGRIKPCRAIDLGCGSGNYAVWLAGQEFDVTGIDISEEAIALANERASQEGRICNFVRADMLGDMNELPRGFDFAFDWEVLHHIFPDDRMRYLKNVHNLLKPGGVYLSVCFSEKDSGFGGKGKFRHTPLGTTLYFSSEEELKAAFEQFFDILNLITIEIPGKHGPHWAVAALLKRRE